MDNDPQPKVSFSAASRWGIRVNYALRTLVVLAVIIMLNYLGTFWNHRSYLSSQTHQQLSPLTIGLLRTLTNNVKVTLLYNKDDDLFATVSALLNDYHNINSRLTVSTVDEVWDAAAAEKVKNKYREDLAGVTNKNLIIFDCEGRGVKIVNGNALAEYVPEIERHDSGDEYRRRPVLFMGEKMFTAALLAVTSPRQLKAYFLAGHGEHLIESSDETGYLKFAAVLHQNYMRTEQLSLVGSNDVPGDCDLLVIAGPRSQISTNELEKVHQYLTQGGRLLAMFQPATIGQQTGLERLLARWQVIVGDSSIVDGQWYENRGDDVVINAYAKHPLVSSMAGFGVYMIRPRPLAPMESRTRDGATPKVQLVAFTSTNTVMANDLHGPLRQMGVVAVVENAVPGVVTERGTTRILVVGDSLFLDNQCIDRWYNRDFAGCAVNWLLERTQLLAGLGPRPVHEYRVMMTRSQFKTLRWILLGAMPGGVLLLGGLVWLRRRS